VAATSSFCRLSILAQPGTMRDARPLLTVQG
jgi:hypothetical protein